MGATGNDQGREGTRRASRRGRAGALRAGAVALLLLALGPAEGRASRAPRRGNAPPAAERGGGAPGPGRSVRLNFREADIGQVLEYFSIAAEKTLVVPPGLKGRVTILNSRPVSLQAGFRALEAVLQARGYTLEQGPLLLRVVPLRPQRTSAGREPVAASAPPARPGRAGGPQVAVLKLTAASAPQVAQIINTLFRPTLAVRGVAARSARRAGNRRQAAPTPAVLLAPAVRASADEYTNSVVVVAPPSLAGAIRAMVAQLDRKTPSNMTTRVFRLRCAGAAALAPEVSQVLMGVAPASAAGSPLQAMPLRRRVQLLSRPGSLNPGGQVVPEARTNSLVVSATAANMALVEKLLGRLDTPAHARPTAVVVPLHNARAADLGLLLNETFNPTNRGSSNGVALPRTSASAAGRSGAANPARASSQRGRG